MDIPSSTRPTVSQGSVLPGRSESAQDAPAVRTELAKPKSVDQPPKTEQATNQALNDETRQKLEALAEEIRKRSEKRIVKDDSTGDLVYRTIEPDTGTVTYQFPDENAMKLRAYLKEMENRSEVNKASELKPGVIMQRVI